MAASPHLDAPARRARRPWSRTALVALAALVSVFAAVYGLGALPLVLWAGATEPSGGRQRPFVHAGLAALPFVAGAVAAVAAGVVAWWCRSGRPLPEPPPAP